MESVLDSDNEKTDSDNNNDCEIDNTDENNSDVLCISQCVSAVIRKTTETGVGQMQIVNMSFILFRNIVQF